MAGVLVAVLLLLRTLFAGLGAGEPSNQAGQSGRAAPSGGATPTGTHDADVSPGHTPRGTITASPGAGGPPAAGDDGHTVPVGNNGTEDSGSEPGSNSGPDSAPACPDSALRLVVDTDQAAYQAGDHPLIQLSLTNTSTTACTRDVGAAEQEALVYPGRDPGNQRFWSSNDCDPGGEADPRVIGVGQTLRFSVTWPAVSSDPDCVGTPAPAVPGDYSVVARVGSLHSDPARFTLG